MKKIIVMCLALAACDFKRGTAEQALDEAVGQVQFMARNGASTIDMCVQVSLIMRLAVEAQNDATYQAFAAISKEKCPW